MGWSRAKFVRDAKQPAQDWFRCIEPFPKTETPPSGGDPVKATLHLQPSNHGSLEDFALGHSRGTGKERGHLCGDSAAEPASPFGSRQECSAPAHRVHLHS